MWQQACASGGSQEEYVFFQRIDKINTFYGKQFSPNNIQAKLSKVQEKVREQQALTEEELFLQELRIFFDGIFIYQKGK